MSRPTEWLNGTFYGEALTINIMECTISVSQTLKKSIERG
jgi:hypothetical protein